MRLAQRLGEGGDAPPGSKHPEEDRLHLFPRVTHHRATEGEDRPGGVHQLPRLGVRVTNVRPRVRKGQALFQRTHPRGAHVQDPVIIHRPLAQGLGAVMADDPVVDDVLGPDRLGPCQRMQCQPLPRGCAPQGAAQHVLHREGQVGVEARVPDLRLVGASSVSEWVLAP
jgi:hypothetical protein